MGITVDSLRNSGHIPLIRELLNMFASGVEIDLLTDRISCLGMLFGPVLLVVSNLEIISSTSAGDVGLNMKDLGLGLLKYWWKFLLPGYFLFCNIFSATVE